MKITRSFLVCSLVAAAASAFSQVNSQSDGSDGAFNPTGTTFTVPLNLATPGDWFTTPGTGNGVYDGSKWAVVFKYSSVNIPNGTTVKFTNHPKNPPVVWLVQGDVTIDGTLNLSGANGTYISPLNKSLSVPGPGGFRGGSWDSIFADGFGPGGSKYDNSAAGASYGTLPANGNTSAFGPIYGNSNILPLIGGSGSAPYNGWQGGAGGGAILIIASGSITVSNTGTIIADGGPSSGAAGSGGAIRLIANQIVGNGVIRASRGNSHGGDGRIRLERLDAGSSFSGTVVPAPSSVPMPSADPVIWPPSTQPTLVVTSVDGVAVPSDPASNFAAPDTQIGPAATSIVRLEAANIPTDGTWRVQVRIVPRNGASLFVNATYVSGNQVASIWEANITIPQGGSAVTARAYKL